MTFRYFLARLRKNIWQTAAGAVTLFVVSLCLIFASALPSALNSAVLSYNRQICGDSDLMLTNAEDTTDRFFGLADLRNDPVLSANSVYINGYFKSFAQIGLPGAEDSEYCTLYAADYNAQNDYNPINTGLITDFYEGDIIVGAEFAAKHALERGAGVNIFFGGKTVPFYIAGIAEPEGLFYTGNAVFVSSRALARFNQLFGSTIVTHCFIKAKDAGSLAAVNQRLTEGYARLKVLPAEEAAGSSGIIGSIVVPAVCVTAIAIAFCLLSLIILLRLVFARDRENFALLRMLGMPEKRIAVITALTGLLICASALTAAFFAAGAMQQLFWSTSLLLRGFKIGAAPYAIGIGGGFAAGMVCALLSGREYKKAAKAATAKKQSGSKTAHLPAAWIFAAASAVFAVAGILLMRPLPQISFAMMLAALAGFILALPKALSPVFSALYRLKSNIYTLRLKTLAKSPDWQRFLSFVMAGMLVILTVTLPSVNIRKSSSRSDYPFEVALSGIRNPSEAFFQSVSDAEGVLDAVKSELHPDAHMFYNGLKMTGSLIALEPSGFSYFGADYAQTSAYGGTGAVIGQVFAAQKSLRIGDRISFERGKNSYEFTVAGIIKSGYINGNFVLVGLDRIAAPSRPYSDILIKADGTVGGVISGIGTAAGAGAEIIDLKKAQSLMSGMVAEFTWLLDVLCGLIAVLASVTVMLMILMRRAAAGEDVRRMEPLGLTRSANIKHNLFSVFLGLLPFFAFLPFLILLICKSSLYLYDLFGMRIEMLYTPSAITAVASAGLVLVTLMEGVMCAFRSKQRN